LDTNIIPTGKDTVILDTARTNVPTSNGIYYHGGPVMLNVVNVYLIWYGNWGNNTATTILPDFVSNLSGSPYLNVNTTYYDGSNNHVSGLVSLAGTTTDNYSQGTTLTDTTV